jgi:hypothetical protein
MDLLTQNYLVYFPWRLLYQNSFTGSWVNFYFLRPTPGEKARASLIFQSLKSKEQLEQLEVDGLHVGDLIYDTYLRYRPAPTVELTDPFLLELIEYVFAMNRRIDSLFAQYKVSRYFTVYTSYIQHGLLVRHALKRGVVVHSLGAFNQLVVKPTPEFPFHKRQFSKYRDWFSSVPEPEEILNRSKDLIQKRLAGQADELTFYMKKSAYADPGAKDWADSGLDDRPKVLVMGHDFFDSPHIYGSMLYPDFYEWLKGVLSFAKESPYQFLIKPHPNGSGDQEAVYASICRDFPNVILLDKGTSNRALTSLKIEYVVTVYGTVAYEFSAQGYTVLCCGMNPHSHYSFSYQVQTRDELARILLGKEKPELKIDLNEVYEFVSIHNYRFYRRELQFFPWQVEVGQLHEFLMQDLELVSAMERAIQECDRV